ncbi:MAG TPA: imidazole glycerol phosphate synthase subunit HisH [Phycisphaerales bacterium]|nr:imidazole glycerol phosphate synthase subunit HisH [Phycisphaerales bacterium]
MIAVIDYGMGNLRSVAKALQKVGGDARIVESREALARATKIVLPGVAAFGDAIDRIRAAGLDRAIVDAVRAGTPYLGFCLGLQLLFDVSYEYGEHRGLGILPGKVVRFAESPAGDAERIKIPHIGWNQVRLRGRNCPLLAGVDDGAYFYFDHSYHVVPADESIIAATTEYGGEFVSAVWKDNVFASQFHPEKSQTLGLKILENFVRL